MNELRLAQPPQASQRSGRPFEDVLRRLAARLDLPQPAKSRTLLEVAGDLEDLYRHGLDLGLDEEAARAAALARFQLSDQALAELATIHTTKLRRFLDSLSERGRSRFERSALSALLLFVGALIWQQLASAGFLEQVGPGALPSAALLLVALAIGARKAWRLWLVQDHNTRGLHDGLAEILLAAAGGFVLGTLGLWLEIYLTARNVAAAFAAQQASAGMELLAGLRGATATATAALLCALACCLLWWLLARKVVRIEHAETEYLLRE